MTLRSILFALFAMALLATSVEAAPGSPNADSPEGVVIKVYRDFAWEAVMAEGSGGLMEQSRIVLKQYFDEKLVSLILKDRACAEKEGQCKLDFLPIWASQDPGAEELKVKKTDKTNIIAVNFRYPSTTERIDLRYRVTKTSKGWRISDIEGKDWSLLSILSPPHR